VDYLLLTIAPVLIGGLRAVEHLLPQVRKTPSWPRSWPNVSL
jgi:hypothetical protein